MQKTMIGRQAQQGHPDQRQLAEVDGHVCLAAAQRQGFIEPLFLGNSCQIDNGQMEIEAADHSLHGFAVSIDEPRAQDLVPVDNCLKGFVDRRSISRNAALERQVAPGAE
jgi:hypothetical protein